MSLMPLHPPYPQQYVKVSILKMLLSDMSIKRYGRGKKIIWTSSSMADCLKLQSALPCSFNGWFISYPVRNVYELTQIQRLLSSSCLTNKNEQSTSNNNKKQNEWFHFHFEKYKYIHMKHEVMHTAIIRLNGRECQ